MEIKERKENKILNRVELSFSWKHDKKSTPSRKEVIALVQTLEPGANSDLIVVKDCNTRFGQPLTTGTAYIYNSAEAMAVEPGTSKSATKNCEVPLPPMSPPQMNLKEAMSDGRRTEPQGQVVEVQGGRRETRSSRALSELRPRCLLGRPQQSKVVRPLRLHRSD